MSLSVIFLEGELLMANEMSVEYEYGGFRLPWSAAGEVGWHRRISRALGRPAQSIAGALDGFDDSTPSRVGLADSPQQHSTRCRHHRHLDGSLVLLCSVFFFSFFL